MPSSRHPGGWGKCRSDEAGTRRASRLTSAMVSRRLVFSGELVSALRRKLWGWKKVPCLGGGSLLFVGKDQLPMRGGEGRERGGQRAVTSNHCATCENALPGPTNNFWPIIALHLAELFRRTCRSEGNELSLCFISLKTLAVCSRE